MMSYQGKNRRENDEQNTILFVWDGGAGNMATVADYADSTHAQVIALRTLPHESIYSYGAAARDADNKFPELQMRIRFQKLAAKFPALEAAQIHFAFGDRIAEIVHFYSRYNVTSVLLPRFNQSSFSLWMHGDLDRKIRDRLKCDVVFLESSYTARSNSGKSGLIRILGPSMTESEQV